MSPSGSLVAATHRDWMRVWSVATGEEVQRFDGTGSSSLVPIQFSPDDRSLVARREGELLPVLWDITTGEMVREWPDLGKFTWLDGRLLQLRSTPQGYIAVDLDTERVLTALPSGYAGESARSAASRIAVHADGSIVSVAHPVDGVLREYWIHELPAGTLLGRILAQWTPTFSSDGRFFTAVVDPSNGVGLYRSADVLDALPVVAVRSDGPSLSTWGGLKRNEPLQNYPNPFNPDTWIPFTLSEPAHVTLRIYDQSGARIRTLDLGAQDAGAHVARDDAAHWDGRTGTGERVASGVYICRIDAADFTESRRMLLSK